jgi:hypothetical protein
VRIVLSLLLIFSVSPFVGCSSLPESTREMEARAEYGKLIPSEPKAEMPRRKKQRVEKIYMGGRFLSSGDWFVGGRLLLVVNESDWIFDDSALKKIESK